ncbi:uncharacterized protein LOC143022177 [Oratosquilla oratoria]|uniref:uncharacterized protein LOC143022177 n=1 Tax=Oratosquilla oratoria TaxID=337810 RepID=UPI003F761810
MAACEAKPAADPQLLLLLHPGYPVSPIVSVKSEQAEPLTYEYTVPSAYSGGFPHYGALPHAAGLPWGGYNAFPYYNNNNPYYYNPYFNNPFLTPAKAAEEPAAAAATPAEEEAAEARKKREADPQFFTPYCTYQHYTKPN